MSEREPRERPNKEAEQNQDSPKEPGESAPEPDPAVCERRRSGQFGYRSEDWPSR